MPELKLVSEYHPTGDQPQSIQQLVENIDNGLKYQTPMRKSRRISTRSSVSTSAWRYCPLMPISLR